MWRKLSFTSCMVKFVVSVCLLVHTSNSECNTADSQYMHSILGPSVSCYCCHPGEYLVDYCSQDGGKSVCKPCAPGMYNSHFSMADHCVECDACREREEADKNCTLKSKTSCVCREEFYRDSSNQCVVLTECPPGKGVRTEGGRHRDTDCEDCGKGYYSNVTSKIERCKKCSVCSKSDERVLRSCTSTNDTVCESYESNKDYGLILGLTFGIGPFLILAIVLVFWLFCSESGKKRLQAIKICCPGSPDYKNDNGRGSSYEVSYPTQDGTQLIPENPWLINEQDVKKVSEELIVRDYKMFFRYLFSEYADRYIDEIEMDFGRSPVREQIYLLLKKWQDVEKDNATKNKFIAALRKYSWNLLADKYSNYWNITDDNVDKLDTDNGVSITCETRTHPAPGETTV